jgi:2-succinyl-6-hydroxy-2,4-cyclohexadiene-1-carboxylate synthase
MPTHVRPATATTLAHRVVGSGRRVVVVHGFAQTGGCLGPLAGDLARDHQVVLPDAPAHGASAAHLGASLADGAALLAATGGRAVYVGYSMGGRLCLQLAVDHPELVEALVVVGATAGIADDEERHARRRRDLTLAERVEALGVDAFLAEWLALPLFAGLPAWARFDDERRANTAAGLADHLRHAGTGSMAPLWDRLPATIGERGVPVCCVTGGEDRPYVQLADRLAAAIGPAAATVVVPDAGHAAHLEAPDAVVAAVRSTLADARPS